MLDLDHFKVINDNYGHQTGDMVLRKIAEEVESLLRKDSMFARYGGEEFTVFIPDTSRASVESIAERIRNKVELMMFPLPMQDHKVTVSIGACWNKEPSISFDEMIREADKALYKAKEGGRNRVAFSE